MLVAVTGVAAELAAARTLAKTGDVYGAGKWAVSPAR